VKIIINSVRRQGTGDHPFIWSSDCSIRRAVGLAGSTVTR
jgi:hypothetical protein